jgi:regulator-associated protein of mTOR
MGTAGHHRTADDDFTNQAVAEWLDGFGDGDILREEHRVLLSSFFTIFVVLLDLSVDPYHEVATNAQTVVDYIMAVLLESPFTRLDCTTLDVPPTLPPERRSPQIGAHSRVTSLQSSPSLNLPPPSVGGNRPGLTRNDTMTSTISTGVSNTIRRTSSLANVLKTLAGGIAFPSTEDGRSSPAPGANQHLRSELADSSRPPSPNLNIAQYSSPYSRPLTPQGNVVSQSSSSSPQLSNDIPRPPMDFLPCDVMEALMEEDMERLRARRRVGLRPRRHHPSGGVSHGSIPSPSSSTFSMDSNSSNVILGLGTGVGMRDVLPLKSTFFDWCCEYFTEPQMRVSFPSCQTKLLISDCLAANGSR